MCWKRQHGRCTGGIPLTSVWFLGSSCRYKLAEQVVLCACTFTSVNGNSWPAVRESGEYLRLLGWSGSGRVFESVQGD